MTSNQELLNAALACQQAGLSVMPVYVKDKHPGIDDWRVKDFTWQELEKSLRNGHDGIGINKGIEVLDFDNDGYPSANEMLKEWKELVNELSPGLIELLTIEKTQNDGYHICYKCSVIETEQDLAKRPATPEELEKTPQQKHIDLIELKNKAVISPSPGYELIQGDWSKLQEITPEQREILINCARTFNRIPTKEKHISNGVNKRPGDRYNAECATEALDLLRGIGWTIVKSSRDGSLLLTRPGKNEGVSATWDHIPNKLYVFSSNASPFEQDTVYDPFAIYTLLEHGGDFSKAAKVLADKFDMNDIEPIKKTVFVFYDDIEETESDAGTEWYIEDVLQRRGINVICGDYGTAKTPYVHSMLFSLISGKPFFGKFKVSKPLSTILYATSEGVGGIKPRFQAYSKLYRADYRGKIFRCSTIPQLLDDKKFPHSLDQFANAWVAEHGSRKIEVLVLDTLHRALSTTDSDDGKMAQAFRNLSSYSEIWDTVILNHHTNYGGRPRGTSAIGQDATSLFILTKDEKKGDKIFTAKCEKQKDILWESFEPLYFRLANTFQPISNGGLALLEETDMPVVIPIEKPVKTNEKSSSDQNKAEQVIKLVIPLLREKSRLSQSDIERYVTEVMKGKGEKISRQTILNALKILEDDRKVKTEGGGRGKSKYYSLSDEYFQSDEYELSCLVSTTPIRQDNFQKH